MRGGRKRGGDGREEGGRGKGREREWRETVQSVATLSHLPAPSVVEVGLFPSMLPCTAVLQASLAHTRADENAKERV